MTVARIEAVGRPAEAFEVRTVTAADLRDALRQGWSDFLEHRGDLLFVGIIYPLVGFAAAAVALQDSLVPLFFPLAAGVGLMGPAVAGGFYELARRREQGLESGWSHFFDVVRRPSFDAFLAVAALLLAGCETLSYYGKGVSGQLRFYNARVPIADVLLIVRDDDPGAMLYRYTAHGEFGGDTWHASEEDARAHAVFEYGDALLLPWMMAGFALSGPIARRMSRRGVRHTLEQTMQVAAAPRSPGGGASTAR